MLSPEELLSLKNASKPAYPALPPKISIPTHSDDEKLLIAKSLDAIEEYIFAPTVKLLSNLSKAVWDEDLKKAEVQKRVGNWLTMGHMANGKFYLHPEEALYLLEKGSIEITYNGLPMSIQRAYAVFIKNADLNLDHYRVYSDLTNSGYRVLRHRHPSTYILPSKVEEEPLGKKPKLNEEELSCFSNFVTQMKWTFPNQDMHNKFVYDIFKKCETPNFKKTIPQSPHYRVCIVRHTEEIPCAKELCRLHFDNVPLLYAVVHPDFIGYYQLSPMELPSV